jgi:hypothetical protein
MFGTIDLLVLTSSEQLLLVTFMQQWGGQLYWAFPFSEGSLVRALYDSEHSSLSSKILNHKWRDLLFEPSLQQSAISFFFKIIHLCV